MGSGTFRLPVKGVARAPLEVAEVRMQALVAFCRVRIPAAEGPRFPGHCWSAPG